MGNGYFTDRSLFQYFPRPLTIFNRYWFGILIFWILAHFKNFIPFQWNDESAIIADESLEDLILEVLNQIYNDELTRRLFKCWVLAEVFLMLWIFVHEDLTEKARKLLKLGIDIKIIKDTTGISEEEL